MRIYKLFINKSNKIKKVINNLVLIYVNAKLFAFLIQKHLTRR
jgi:hypothetical protein